MRRFSEGGIEEGWEGWLGASAREAVASRDDALAYQMSRTDGRGVRTCHLERRRSTSRYRCSVLTSAHRYGPAEQTGCGRSASQVERQPPPKAAICRLPKRWPLYTEPSKHWRSSCRMTSRRHGDPPAAASESGQLELATLKRRSLPSSVAAKQSFTRPFSDSRWSPAGVDHALMPRCAS